MNMGLEESEESAELLELDLSKQLGENVANHVVSRTVLEFNVASSNSLVNEMEMNIDMFGGIRTHAAKPNRYQQCNQSRRVASKLIELVSRIP
jgi:hypothetical protein